MTPYQAQTVYRIQLIAALSSVQMGRFTQSLY